MLVYLKNGSSWLVMSIASPVPLYSSCYCCKIFVLFQDLNLEFMCGTLICLDISDLKFPSNINLCPGFMCCYRIIAYRCLIMVLFFFFILFYFIFNLQSDFSACFSGFILLLTCFCHRELYSNNISGKVPNELGNLTNLVSLDLYLNNLNGPIPDTLGKLQKLRFLYELRILRLFTFIIKFIALYLSK